MVYTIKISTIAQREIEKSYNWYEKRLIGLGLRFSNAIYNSITEISVNPEAYPRKKKYAREFVVREFPFLIIYEFLEQESTVNVLHVFHTSRNPKLKYKKK